jgi:hypothetical protein
MQFDMFAVDEPVLDLAPEPAPIVVEYAPVGPVEPRPERAADLIGWTMRTQRAYLVHSVGALSRAPALQDFFSASARVALFKLDGIGSDW